MSDQQFVIDFGDEGRGIVDTSDRSWLEEKLRREPGSTRLRLSLDDYDTEGHGAGGGTLVRVVVDDDDTEGHALSIHFPTAHEADAFRKRVMLAGVLVGTVAIGTATGAGLASLQSGSDAGAAGMASSAVTGSAWTQEERPAAAVEITPGSAWTQEERPGTGVVDATQAGPMDVHEAPAFQGLSRADQAYADRLSGQAAASQAGPMDVHEAPAFQGLSRADQAYADRLSGQAAGSQAGPMDVHEAPAFQSEASQTGPMDVHEAPAFQAESTSDDADDTAPSLGGPTPR